MHICSFRSIHSFSLCLSLYHSTFLSPGQSSIIHLHRRPHILEPYRSHQFAGRAVRHCQHPQLLPHILPPPRQRDSGTSSNFSGAHAQGGKLAIYRWNAVTSGPRTFTQRSCEFRQSKPTVLRYFIVCFKVLFSRHEFFFFFFFFFFFAQ